MKYAMVTNHVEVSMSRPEYVEGNKVDVNSGSIDFFFFKQKTAYEIGTGDWSSDVCSSDLADAPPAIKRPFGPPGFRYPLKQSWPIPRETYAR